MVGAVAGGSNLEEGLALGQVVLVQQHLLGPTFASGARMYGVLGAQGIAAVVGIGAVRRGDGAVVLLDAPLHLGEQDGLKVLRPGQHRAREGVLGVQMLADIGAQHLGIAQHLLPIVVLHPGVVVGPRTAELGDCQGTTGRSWGGEEAHRG